MQNPIFSILISTKNRVQELSFTLNSIKTIMKRNDVECLVCDDGSNDGTSGFILENYPEIKLITHKKSKGYIHSRNKLLAIARAKYSISLDDDAHIVSENSLEYIAAYFNNNPKCGLIAARIFWGKKLPFNYETDEKNNRVKSFVGCGHVWKMKAWYEIPDYPEWFEFYGEEDFASHHLFKIDLQIHFVPQIFVQHRVDSEKRKTDKADYYKRLRMSIRSGWYLYTLFYPSKIARKKIIYSIYAQFKNRIFKGDFMVFWVLIQITVDYLQNLKRMKSNTKMSMKQFTEYENLDPAVIYWKPNAK